MHWLSSSRSRAAAGLPTHSNYTGFDETVNAVGLNPVIIRVVPFPAASGNRRSVGRKQDFTVVHVTINLLDVLT